MNFLKTILLLCLFILVFASCEKDQNIETTAVLDSEKNEILDYLDANKYNLDSVEFRGDFVIYERDAAWYKPDLLKTIRGEFITSESLDPDAADMLEAIGRQRAVTEDNRLDAITASNVSSIRYFIRPSVLNDCGSAWVNAIDNAAVEWNNLSDCRVNMSRLSTQVGADIVFGSDIDTGMPTGHQNLQSGEIALASLPVGGAPGRFVSINTSYKYLPKKKTSMMHEIGHTLGFRHTGSSDGQHVHGTPANESGSVMNPTFFTASSNFKAGDKRMTRMYYPNSYNMPTNFDVNSLGYGELRVTYQNPFFNSRPYYWIRVATYNTSGNILSVQYFPSRTNSTGVHNFTFFGNFKGSYLFAVRGCNFRRDVWSPRSPLVLETF